MEIQYFASRRDTIELGRFLIREFGCTFYDDHSSTEHPMTFVTDEAVRSRILTARVPGLWHVTSPSWSNSPIEMSGPFIRDAGAPYWYVTQRHGGPAFIWSLPGECDDGKRKWLRLGMFGDWPTYYFGPDSVEQPRPATMTDAFKEVSKQIRRGAKRTRWKATGGVGPWISADAYRLCDAGFSIFEDLDLSARARDRRPGK